MSDTTAQYLRDVVARSVGKMTWDELDVFLAKKMEDEAMKGNYTLILPFADINANSATIEEWQRVAKQPQCDLNVVIQTPNQVNKELMIKWG